MKRVSIITDKKLINEVLKSAVYGTLALAANKKPYAVPVNYVYYKDAIYFHSSPKQENAHLS